MSSILWYFWIYSFLGWLVELAYAAVSRSEDRRRRCLLFLPLCPVYGLGMLAVLALPPMGLPALIVFGGLAATTAEYVYHWFGEWILSVRFWDYTEIPGNLRGRVCPPFALAWGILTALAVRLVHPAVEALALAVPPAITYVCLLLFTADAACSWYFLRVTGDLRALRTAFF